MSGADELKRAITDRVNLPGMFPTHRHTPEFWEHLGRAIASFGFLEEVLGKAIFAFTGTRQYPPDKIDVAYDAWLPKLEKALTDQLWNLIEVYGKVVREHPKTTTQNVDDLVKAMKAAAAWRNVLCHASWRTPDENGASVPFFVNKQKERCSTPVDIDFLMKIQMEAAALACDVIDTVTHMGWQFPGGAGPGKPIMG
jgi:hypothetical protein